MQASGLDELDGVELGDARLDARAQVLYQALTQSPGGTFSEAFGSRASKRAGYRFFENDRVTHDALLAPHFAASVDRCREHQVVLVAQDTTDLDFTGHQVEGVGHLYNPKNQGVLVHSALAVSPTGVPLGLLFQHVWARDPDTVGKAATRRKRDFLDKESVRWLDAEKAAGEIAGDGRRVVVIADREGDIFEWLEKPRVPGLDRLVPACRDRVVVGGGKLLSEVVPELPILGTMKVEVGRGKDQKPRTAALVLRAGRIEIPPPANLKNRKAYASTASWVVYAEEKAAPAGAKAIKWILLASWPVETEQAAQEAVQWYSRRWSIERFHFTLKSGCMIEKLQFESAEAIMRALALYSIAAWRLLWLTMEARTRPDDTCEGIVEPDELHALHTWLTGDPKPPKKPLTLKQFVRKIADLGGFMGTKATDPGVKVLWRGWSTFQIAVSMFRAVTQASKRAKS